MRMRRRSIAAIALILGIWTLLSFSGRDLQAAAGGAQVYLFMPDTIDFGTVPAFSTGPVAPTTVSSLLIRTQNRNVTISMNANSQYLTTSIAPVQSIPVSVIQVNTDSSGWVSLSTTGTTVTVLPNDNRFVFFFPVDLRLNLTGNEAATDQTDPYRVVLMMTAAI